MPNLWMLRTYAPQYDPWKRPISEGMEEPWLVKPEDHTLMADGDRALLFLMDPQEAFGKRGRVVFAVGEISVGSVPSSTSANPTPASAVLERNPRGVQKAVPVSVRYTRILDRPTGFKTIDQAIPSTGLRPHWLRDAGRLSTEVDPTHWEIIERLQS